jgi:hypothetical protein
LIDAKVVVSGPGGAISQIYGLGGFRKKNMTKKVKCSAHRCDWRGQDDELLKAQNPFDADDIVIGCPKCKSIDSIVCVCDEDGCWDPGTCGTPTPDGYRNTCWKHRPNAELTGRGLEAKQ